MRVAEWTEPRVFQGEEILRWSDVHRLIMESHIGRKLGRFEVVHHRNGDKLDNRLENLEVMSLEEHSRIHADSDQLRARALASGQRPPLHVGSQVHNAAINEDTAATVKAMLAAGLSVRGISAHLKVSRFTIYKIRQGKTWRHVSAGNWRAA